MLSPMDMRAAILSEISEFLRRSGMSKTAFGREAVSDGKLIPRLEAGHDIGLNKVQRIREFMAAHAENSPPAKDAA